MLLLLIACAPKDAAETAVTETGNETGDETGDETGETAGDSAGETGDTGDSGDTGDTGEPPVGDDGLLAWEGHADVADGWAGSEAVVFIENTGLGDTLCRIDYTVTGTAPREDCADCLVAWDVVLGPATVTIDERCDVTGYDAAAVAAIEGETRGYGVALDFVGHSNVLMVFLDGRWTAGSFVTWSEAEETVSYLWEQDVIAY